MEPVPKRKLRLRTVFGLVLEQAFGENCSFFMSWAVAVYPMFSRGKKLFQN
jgi:hypothetical protein